MKLLTEKQKVTTAPQDSWTAGIHCGAHKLSLVANQAAKAVPYVGKFKDVVQLLYCFRASSSVRMAELSAIQKILNTGQGGDKVSEPSATSLLSVGKPCTTVQNNIAAITESLSQEAEERSDVKSARLLKLLKFILNEKFVGTLLMMCKVLPSVDRLLKALQSKLLHLDLLEGMIKPTIKTLEAQKNIQIKVRDFCATNDIPLRVSQESEEWLQATKRTFLEKLVQNNKDRFDD